MSEGQMCADARGMGTTYASHYFTPVANRALHRKCGCGQHTGGGECAACKKKRSGIQQNDWETRLDRTTSDRGQDSSQRDFTEMRVSAKPSETRSGQLSSPIGTKQSMEEKRGPKYSEHGVLITDQGSGTCQNGGAESVCDPTNGAYKIIRNSNTCCTSACSRLHEQVHVSDVTSWGCCRALSVAYNKPGADKNAAVQKYNNWMNLARPLTECHAYTGDVECANSLAKQKNCTGAGRNSDCCKDIEDYRVRYQAKANSECAAAPRDAPACPAF